MKSYSFLFPLIGQRTDYTSANPLSVVFSAGSSDTGTTACADVTIINDRALESDHFFTVTVTGLELNPGGAYSGLMFGMPSAQINIVDNEGTID